MNPANKVTQVKTAQTAECTKSHEIQFFKHKILRVLEQVPPNIFA